MSKFSLVIKKLKSAQAINAALAHNLRKYVPKNADASRAGENVHLISPLAKSYSGIKSMIPAPDVRMKKEESPVMMNEILIQAGRKTNTPFTTREEWTSFYTDALAELRRWHRESIFVSAEVHYDELIPHLHVLMVPCVKRRNKLILSHRGAWGGADRSILRDWQQRFETNLASLHGMYRTPRARATHTQINDFYAAATRTPKPFPSLDTVRTPDISLPPSPPAIHKRTTNELIAWAQGYAAEEVEKAALTLKSQIVEIVTPQWKGLDSRARYATLLEEQEKMLDLTQAQIKEFSSMLRPIDPADYLMRTGYRAGADGSTWVTEAGLIRIDRRSKKPAIKLDDKLVGYNVIDMVKAIDQCSFDEAVTALSQVYDVNSAVGTGAAAALDSARKAATEPATTDDKFAPVSGNLRLVRNYLEKTRCIPHAIVDFLIRTGTVWADKNCNAIFKTGKDTIFIRGTKRGVKFVSERGPKQLFRLDGPENSDVIFVEGVIDAISLKALWPDATVIATCGDNKQKMLDEAIKMSFVGKRRIVAAFDSDGKGPNKYLKDLQDAIGPISPVVVMHPPIGKDWNDCLVTATHNSIKAIEIRKHIEKSLVRSNVSTASTIEKQSYIPNHSLDFSL